MVFSRFRATLQEGHSLLTNSVGILSLTLTGLFWQMKFSVGTYLFQCSTIWTFIRRIIQQITHPARTASFFFFYPVREITASFSLVCWGFLAGLGFFFVGECHFPLWSQKTSSLIKLCLLLLFFSCICLFWTYFQSNSLIIQNECSLALRMINFCD